MALFSHEFDVFMLQWKYLMHVTTTKQKYDDNYLLKVNDKIVFYI